MFNAAKRLLRRSVLVTLKRPNGSGMTYREVTSLLDNMRDRDMDATKITMSAGDLRILIKAAQAVRDAEVEDRSLKNGFGDVPFISGMSEDYNECGMGSILYVCPAYGTDITCAYELVRCDGPSW